MTIHYENESQTETGLDLQELAKTVLDAALDYLDCPYEAEVNLLVTDDAQIRELNRSFRQIDRATDVLSFPMIPFEVPGDFSFLEDDEKNTDCFHPESGELLLGDIVVSAQRAVAQAREYGHSVKREFAFLIAHSLLHLCGFDHMAPEDAADMEARQKSILEQLEINR